MFLSPPNTMDPLELPPLPVDPVQEIESVWKPEMLLRPIKNDPKPKTNNEPRRYYFYISYYASLRFVFLIATVLNLS